MIDRRRFLQWLSLAPAWVAAQFPGSLSSARPRPLRNPFRKNGKPLLVVVSGGDTPTRLTAGLGALPGLDELVRGKRVVLKPNATALEPYPVTTDPSLLRELVLFLKLRKAAEVTIYDSPSYAGWTATRVFGTLGYSSLAAEEKVRTMVADPLVGSDFIKVHNPVWKNNSAILTTRVVHGADFVINLSIPKRHHTADFSCAMKNNFGCTAETFRALAHAGDSQFFDRSIAEYADAVRPELTIVDAREVLAGAGPGFQPGKSRIVPANRMILTGDMVAADSYSANLLEQFDPTFSRAKRVEGQLEYASKLGLGEPELSRVEILNLSA